jgi:hypothetical protein
MNAYWFWGNIRLEVLRIIFCYISYTFSPFSQMFFEDQIVDGGAGIVSVVQHILFGLGFVHSLIVIYLGYHVHVHGDRILANVDALIFSDFDLLVPWMGSDPLDRKSLIWVCEENLSYQVLAAVTYEVWDRVLGIQYLLVQLVGFGVLEWQISANHCVYDDSTTPHVGGQPIVLLASHHLWGSVAWTSTGSLETLASLVGIAQAEVDDLDVVEIVHQQIFRFQISVANAKPMKIIHTGQYLM